ncbi:MAG: hypothetical protein JWQ98_460 [Chlorobi bacterium]|nr:hypothetical protein [Chlorobiota bacterium]
MVSAERRWELILEEKGLGPVIGHYLDRSVLLYSLSFPSRVRFLASILASVSGSPFLARFCIACLATPSSRAISANIPRYGSRWRSSLDVFISLVVEELSKGLRLNISKYIKPCKANLSLYTILSHHESWSKATSIRGGSFWYCQRFREGIRGSNQHEAFESSEVSVRRP